MARKTFEIGDVLAFRRIKIYLIPLNVNDTLLIFSLVFYSMEYMTQVEPTQLLLFQTLVIYLGRVP